MAVEGISEMQDFVSLFLFSGGVGGGGRLKILLSIQGCPQLFKWLAKISK